MAEEEPSVRVTLGEIYKKLLDVEKLVNPVGDLSKVAIDHEGRLRSLERMLWGGAGIGGVVGSVLTLIAQSVLGN